MTSSGQIIKNVYKALNERCFVKAICGAAVNDPQEVERFTFIYTLAGIHAVDVRGEPSIVKAAVKGRKHAYAEKYNLMGPAIIASIAFTGDVHTLKTKLIQGKCTGCDACIPVCRNNAIQHQQGKPTITIFEPRCRGCNRCVETCPFQALYLEPIKNAPFREAIRSCLKAGANGIELHLSGIDPHRIASLLDEIDGLLSPDVLVSICVGSMQSAPAEIISIARCIAKMRKGLTTIIQADGQTMGDSPGSLQALATAEQILSAEEEGIYVISSGAITEDTWAIIDACDLKIGGVGIGVRARELIEEACNADDLYDNLDLQAKNAARGSQLLRPERRDVAGKKTRCFFRGPALSSCENKNMKIKDFLKGV